MNISQKIQYTCLMGACRACGMLPEWVLYHVLSPFIYLVLYRVVHYRLKVVRQNLINSFPEKETAELRTIEQKFYRHLAEVFVDTIHLGSISREKILERMVYRDIEALEEAMRGRSWISAMSHFGSWELTINYVCHTDHRVLAVYRPLHSEAFDRFYQRIRARFGTQPVPMNNILQEALKSKRAGAQPVSIALIADQTPPWHEIKHWYHFLGQETPFFSGVEKMALRLKMPVYFMYIRKVAPQHYEAEPMLIFDGTETVAPHEITERYIHHLETMIRETPELWMWSHRRWKHPKPVDYDITHAHSSVNANTL